MLHAYICTNNEAVLRNQSLNSNNGEYLVKNCWI